MTSREQFEDWYKCDALNRVKWYQESNIDSDLMVDSGGYYFRDAIQRRWEAWEASRAAIEIESPDFIDSRAALNKGYTVDYSNGFGDAMDAYEMAIEQAGLEVKK